MPSACCFFECSAFVKAEPSGSVTAGLDGCPRERRIRFRAEESAGWSVKSGQNRLGKVQPLSEEEQQAILKVVQRAETLEKAEQQRIGQVPLPFLSSFLATPSECKPKKMERKREREVIRK
ncbi:unnamed protein product [Darwinula stevensoni]|uniref:RabBD domain-containing protein n=1 Tax=Darwinula stevensoni TaxID=69355 RepID=A0A7R8XCG8_9CRUS|nr:unnamed protein product [Darwinula stevensoni]CAG0891960.1 unnamed protein product [Darwinula stevensoni]